MRLHIMVANSSLPEEIRDIILELEGDLLELDGMFFNKWDYLEMHQLEPMTQKDPQNQKDINRRLDAVMANEKL